MSQSANRVYDELGKLFTGAASVAKGLKEDASSMVKATVEKFVRDQNFVSRDEFEVATALAQSARKEVETLNERVAALEEKLGIKVSSPKAKPTSSKKPAATTSSAAAKKKTTSSKAKASASTRTATASKKEKASTAEKQA